MSPIEACNAGTVTAALLVLLRLGGGANPTVAEIQHNDTTATKTKVLETNFIMMMLDVDASKKLLLWVVWIDLFVYFFFFPYVLYRSHCYYVNIKKRFLTNILVQASSS